MNSKLLFAISTAGMLLAILAASGCVSIIRIPGSNATGGDVATAIEDFDASEAEGDEGLPAKTVNEGELVSFPNLQAVDPDGDRITYTFTSPLDEDGEWQTKSGDAGKYRVTITASDGTSEVSQDVLIIVRSLNNPPVIGALDDIEIDEGDTVQLNPIVSDEDGDEVEVTFSGWMDSPKKKTNYDDAGTHAVIITASDGKETASRTVTVVVNNVNRPPKINAVADIEVDEGSRVSASVDASDPDGDEVSLEFSEPLGEDGSWSTKIGDAGKYMVKVTASDGELAAKESFYVTVKAVNLPPVIEGVADIEVDETDVVELSVTATDPEGDDTTITFSEPFGANGVWQTGYDDAGEYVVTVTASDGISESEETFTVKVNDRNRAPTFAEGAFD